MHKMASTLQSMHIIDFHSSKHVQHGLHTLRHNSHHAIWASLFKACIIPGFTIQACTAWTLTPPSTRNIGLTLNYTGLYISKRAICAWLFKPSTAPCFTFHSMQKNWPSTLQSMHGTALQYSEHAQHGLSLIKAYAAWG
jgi:hypothetical protein